MVIKRPIAHPNPEVSVVIPTLPENEFELPDTIKNQTMSEYEVVVVSDTKLNRCEARNEGMKSAKGDIIAQTDDDCRPPETWIEQILDRFEENPDLVLLEGFLDKVGYGERGYIGANLAYRRDLAIEIGGFDVELSGWRADTDFGWRMEDTYGIDRCLADPELEIEHIGPLRTDVDRKLEKKFRMRHTKKYFTILYHPDIPLGKKVGSIVAGIYSISPGFGERIIRAVKGVS
jgi:glycosyltransferase involved in cell wall biosynthesis